MTSKKLSRLGRMVLIPRLVCAALLTILCFVYTSPAHGHATDPKPPEAVMLTVAVPKIVYFSQPFTVVVSAVGPFGDVVKGFSGEVLLTSDNAVSHVKGHLVHGTGSFQFTLKAQKVSYIEAKTIGGEVIEGKSNPIAPRHPFPPRSAGVSGHRKVH